MKKEKHFFLQFILLYLCPRGSTTRYFLRSKGITKWRQRRSQNTNVRRDFEQVLTLKSETTLVFVIDINKLDLQWAELYLLPLLLEVARVFRQCPRLYQSRQLQGSLGFVCLLPMCTGAATLYSTLRHIFPEMSVQINTKPYLFYIK